MRSWIRFRRRGGFEADLEAELRDHLERQVTDYIAEGMSEQQARRTAVLTLGGLEQVKENCRDERPTRFLHRVWQDLHYGARAVWRSPLFALAGVCTLGLGFASAFALLSICHAASSSPASFPAGHSIVVLVDALDGLQSGHVFHSVRRGAQNVDHIAAYGPSSGWNLVVDGRAEYVTGVPVSAEFFEVFGVSPRIGRSFTRADEQRDDGPPVVVISDDLWKRVFQSRRDVIGRLVSLGGVAHRIVGVMPNLRGPVPGRDLWPLLRLSEEDHSFNHVILGRLGRNVSVDTANRELQSMTHLGASSASNQVGRGALQWESYPRWLVRPVRNVMLVLTVAALVLLLIACANVASLQLLRAVARRHEFATRMALGASSKRLVLQVVAESLVLAAGGVAAGILLANVGVRWLLTWEPSETLGASSSEFDTTAALAVLLIGVVVGLLISVAPAVAACRLDLRAAFVELGRATVDASVVRLRRVLVIAQIASAVVLLTIGGLFARTLVHLEGVEPGFDATHVVVGKMSLQGFPAQLEGHTGAFFSRILTRIAAVPGVQGVAVSNSVPVEAGINLGLAPPAGGLVHEGRAVDWRYATPNYFTLLGIQLRTGRLFNDADDAFAAPVALVNEAFARTYFGGSEAALGKIVELAPFHRDRARRIIGVVADVKSRSGAGWTTARTALAAPATPSLYVPVAQVPEHIFRLVHSFFPISWVIKTARGPSLTHSIQISVAEVEPLVPFIRFETIGAIVAQDLGSHRLIAFLVLMLAAIAVVLASIGMYAIVSFTVMQRRREIAIRNALGARWPTVLNPIVREGVVLAVVGIIGGMGIVKLTGSIISPLLFEVAPADAVTFTAAGALILLVSGTAVLTPFVRAARLTPLTSLREQ